MSEKDLEVLITLDDPGEDTLEEDNFHHPQVKIPVSRFPSGGVETSEQMSLMTMTARSWLAESCCSRLRLIVDDDNG